MSTEPDIDRKWSLDDSIDLAKHYADDICELFGRVQAARGEQRLAIAMELDTALAIITPTVDRLLETAAAELEQPCTIIAFPKR
jgi:hypothetical protein